MEAMLIGLGMKLIPLVWVVVSPYVTSFITQYTKKIVSNVPPQAQVVLSGVVGAVGAAVTGEVMDIGVGQATGVPDLNEMHVDTTATEGALLGMAGQKLLATDPAKLEKIERLQEEKANSGA